MALASVFCYAALCRGYVDRTWHDPNRWERRIAVNPHLVLLGSCLSGWWPSAGLPIEAAHPDTSDFQPRKRSVPDRPARPAASAQLTASSAPRNLVLVVLESVGVEYLNLYGSPHVTMPRLAKLAAEQGLVFENVYAHCPSSPKGLVALETSTFPRVDWKLITRDNPGFDVPTLGQTLGPLGYRAAYLHSGYWSWKERRRFLEDRGASAIIDADTLAARRVNSWGIADNDLLTAGLHWIDEAPGQPFYLQLWTIETHHPYVAGDRPVDFGTGDVELERYLNALRGADALLARLIDELDRRGLRDSTVVAITGDHGEVFGQHGQRVHSFAVYEENVHVPLVILHPSLREGPRRFAGLCQQSDIPATLLGMLGQTPPDSWQGRDVLTEGARPRAYFYAVSNEIWLGVREGSLKYHYGLQAGSEELFDLLRDPDETNNLAADHPAECRELRSRLAALVRSQRVHLASHGAP